MATTGSFKKFSYSSNLGFIAAGCYLLFVQLHCYQHDHLAEDLRFPAEEHAHMRLYSLKPRLPQQFLR